MNKCEIIKDLLPNYKENLTTNSTNLFIEEHLNNCTYCNNIYKSMNEDFIINSTEKINLNTNEIKCLKKLNKRVSKALILGITLGLLILLIMYICLVSYRFFVLKNLSDNFQNYKQVDNLYFEINDTYFSEDSRFLVNRKTKYWYKDNILKEESSSTDTEFPNVYTRIIDYNNNIEYRYNSINKSLEILEASNENIYKDRKNYKFIFFTYVPQ